MVIKENLTSRCYIDKVLVPVTVVVHFLQNCTDINRGSYMSAHVLLILLNELGKRDKMRGLPSILSFFATSLLNSIKQEHEC